MIRAVLLSAVIVFGCMAGQEALASEVIYKLYPTQNMWTFIKLDTSTGKIWQVHYSINDDSLRAELILNEKELVDEMEKEPGRFILQPTQNMYNFLLMDQKDGRVWQIQWSMKEENRGIISRIL